MAIQYDAEVLVLYAEKLYAKARRAVLRAFVLWGGGLWLAWFIFFAVIQAVEGGKGTLGPVAFAGFIPALVIGGLAAAIAEERAFHLRLEAQRTLCQVQIERNTRNAEQHKRPLDNLRASVSEHVLPPD